MRGKAVVLWASVPVPVGTPERITDEMERWITVADINGFDVRHIINPGTWEDVVELRVPGLSKMGLYAPVGESGTMRERFYGLGNSRLQPGHAGGKMEGYRSWFS